ncbi:hypothetical protein EK21DRAFT_103399 [Setomelanomma holmii]|uniref:Uncharacterized protein n=1 Tax=Setomelanomma holmii TaxID=210430 RepID=A0A9P4LH01_9PLEO|nr:hypothetical protein EK21DRAFT_103399 [Setomelanomma holmii]
MARFRIWLRSYVRNLLHITDRKTPRSKPRSGETYTSIKDLNISAPLLVSHNGVEFVPNSTLPRSLSVQNLKEPHPESHPKHRSADIEVPQSIAMIIEDAPPSPLPVEDVEATEQTPSLCSDISDYTDAEENMPETSTPTTPPPQRISKRYSFLQGLGTLSNHHTRASVSRPTSYVESSSSEGSDTNRMSHYSVMSRTVSKKGKRMSVTSGPGGRRASVMSGIGGRHASVMSGVGGRRASFMSDGWEWEERRLSRGINRMSWGFETYQTHTSMYAPVRV